MCSRDVGELRDTVTIGVANPLRTRAQACLDKGGFEQAQAQKVREWLAAREVTWPQWNTLAEWTEAAERLFAAR